MTTRGLVQFTFSCHFFIHNSGDRNIVLKRSQWQLCRCDALSCTEHFGGSVRSRTALLAAIPRYPLVKYRCTNITAMAPSPTAEAYRFTDPCLTSPAANMPGMLVST